MQKRKLNHKDTKGIKKSFHKSFLTVFPISLKALIGKDPYVPVKTKTKGEGNVDLTLSFTPSPSRG